MKLVKKCLIAFNNQWTNKITKKEVDNDVDFRFTLLDMQKFAKYYHKQKLTLTDVSHQRELLPEFLMHDLDGKIITSVIGSADVTKEWNEYLGNCG